MTSFSFSRLFSRKGSRSSSNSGSDKSKVGSSDHDSQKSQQIQSGGTESANSASRHRFDDQGRRYHNRPDAAYMLPNDDEGIDSKTIHQLLSNCQNRNRPRTHAALGHQNCFPRQFSRACPRPTRERHHRPRRWLWYVAYFLARPIDSLLTLLYRPGNMVHFLEYGVLAITIDLYSIVGRWRWLKNTRNRSFMD